MMRSIWPGLLLAASQSAGPALEEQLARHRNLGKAFYENPTTQAQSVAEFGKALGLAPQSARERLNYGLALLAAGKTAEGIADIEKVQKQQPALPHSWFNLGVQFKKAGEYDKAQEQFEGFAKRAPDDPAGHYNLGVLHKLANRNPAAIAAFETATRLNPNLAAPHFQLYNLYRQAGRRDEAAVQLKLFQAAKDANSSSPASEDMEWSWYSEILDEVDLQSAAGAAEAPREWKFVARRLSPPIPGALTRPVVFDAQGDGRADLAVAVGGNLRLYSGALAPVTIGRDVYFAAVADFNNDGQPDLCALTSRGPVLLVNNKGTFFEKALSAAPPGRYDVAVWLDYDHDYDPDLLLLGETNVLLRNEGASFSDRPADFPFVKGQATGAVAFRLVPDSKAFDLVVSYRDRSAVLYRDKLAGKFEARDLAAIPKGATVTAALDADNSGSIDLLYEAAAGKGAILFNASAPNQDAKLEWIPAAVASPAVAADWENRGVQDVVAGGGAWRYSGVRQYQAGPAIAGLPGNAVAYAAGDFNGDGKPDLAAVSPDGSVHLLTNSTVTPHQSVRIALAGVKNPKLAAGSEVEVKIAGRYQKKIYTGQPLLFGVRDARTIDSVRITWPNGLIQSEANQAVRAQTYQEAQRLSGSCPQVWTWNGHEFVYVTDVLGVAPLGAMAGDGTYFPVDHLEHIQIPAGALEARDGRYEIRLTEELSEVAYLDQVKLIAVDHPAGQSLFINEKFQAPPYPDLKLYGVERRIKPVGTTVKSGESFTMQWGPEARALAKPVLVLSGWVDWADGSQFRAASQRRGGELRMPSLELFENGRWRTVIEDMGLPAGKPKSIVVELKPEWLAGGGALRISSNLAVFWTDAFLAGGVSPAVPVAPALPSRADLRFRGFSRVRIHPTRQEPEMFYYDNPLPSAMWNPTPGNYTRFGDVEPLMREADDRFAIMGSGDELALEFDAAAFPPVPAGHRRSFILAVDGWAKDRDANTAHSATVEPLPFHGMTQYPYSAAERFPDTAAHRAWRREYNSRPALRLIRPLSSLGGPRP